MLLNTQLPPLLLVERQAQQWADSAEEAENRGLGVEGREDSERPLRVYIPTIVNRNIVDKFSVKLIYEHI